MNVVEQIVTAILKWLTGLAKTEPTAEDAKKQPDLKRGLLARIDEHERELRKPGDLRPPR